MLFFSKSRSSLNRRRGTRENSTNLRLPSLIFLVGFVLLIFSIGVFAASYFLTSSDNDAQTGHLPPIVKNTLNKIKLRGARVPLKSNSLRNAKLNVLPSSFLGSSKLDTSNYEPKGGDRYIEWKDGNTPYAFTDELLEKSDSLARQRREHIKAGMKHAWSGYKENALGHDEVLPITGEVNDNWGGIGITLIDALDTLWLMDMKKEFYEARDWVRDSLSHDHTGKVSVFETTIRSLGGLLAAYDWSHDNAFLNKAEDLGNRLLKGFDEESGIPFGEVNLSDGTFSNPTWTGNNAIVSEFGSIQVEFRYLSEVTGKKKYSEKAEKAFKALKSIEPSNGLYPSFVKHHGRSISFSNSKISFGGMGDSLYEYMLKIWIQGKKSEPMYREMYDKSMDGLHAELLQKSEPSGLWYIAGKNNDRLDHTMEHLVCFMGGLLALGAYTDPRGIQSDRAQRDLRAAKAFTYTCYQMYARTPTGISPGNVVFKPGKDFVTGNEINYILRPETVESLYILNKLTGDPIYREMGWEIFQSIEKYCRTNLAYGHLHNVNDKNTTPDNRMESFFLAETMKYLYLLMDPDSEVDILEKHVFNTEGHPMRNFKYVY